MKKGVLLIVFLVLLAGYSYALTVSLSEPTNSQTFTTTDDVTFKCQVDENVSSLKLYHNITGWQENQTNTTEVIPNSDYSFSIINDISNGNYLWNCLANESTFSSSNFTFTIDISTNGAPYYSFIPNMVWPEDTVNNTLDLNSYFTDPDGDNLVYYISDAPNVIVDIDNSTGLVTISPNGNYTGSFVSTFTASDGSLMNTSNGILFNITPVNDPPYLIIEIPNQTWTYGNGLIVDLSEFFGDVDNSKLTYSATNLTNIDITIDNDDKSASLTAKDNWVGSETVVFTANDSLLVVSSNAVNLIVKSGNVAPKIRSHLPLENPKLNLTDSVTFSIDITDADNDNLNIQWYLNSAAITGANSNSYSFTPINKGSFRLSVVVSDGVLTDSYEWTLVVTDFGFINENNTQQKPVNLCGNSEVDAGEGCETCRLDVICSEDEMCIDNKCVLETKSGFRTLIIIIISIFAISLITAFILFYKHKMSFKFKERLLLKDLKTKEDKKSGPRPEELKVKADKKSGPRPIVEIDDIYPDKRKEEPVKKTTKTVSSVMLKKYIESCISKGIPTEKIKKNLLDKGWNKNNVEAALLNFELKKR